MTRYVDITVPLVPGWVPLYPGDTELDVTLVQTRAGGDPANVSSMTCSLHCGTHVDAPAHFFTGEPGVDAIDLDQLIGPPAPSSAASDAPRNCVCDSGPRIRRGRARAGRLRWPRPRVARRR